MVIAIPSSSTVKGWHARPGKETVTINTVTVRKIDHPPERGVPNSRPTTNILVRARHQNVTATTNTMVDPTNTDVPILTGQIWRVTIEPSEDAMAAAWREAGEVLGIDVTAPYYLESEVGPLRCVALVRDFGGGAGIVDDSAGFRTSQAQADHRAGPPSGLPRLAVGQPLEVRA